MHTLCHDFCKTLNKVYPVTDVFTTSKKFWDLKGFIMCSTCEILVSRDKYFDEVRCRCCKGKFKSKPRNYKKRYKPKPNLQPKKDFSNRFCLGCGSNTTYMQKREGIVTGPRWYNYLDGYLCNNCNAKKIHAIRRQLKNQMDSPIINDKLLIYKQLKNSSNYKIHKNK